MTLGIATAIRNSKMDEMTTAIDAGAGAGLLRIYDGTRPITGGTVTTLLAELTLSDPSFAAASSGAITANAITSNTAAASGTATWFRIVDSTSAFVCDGSVATAGADLILNSTTITAGVLVDVTSAVLTDGDA